MMELTIAKCPSCGADIRVAGDGTARCSYCEKDIIITGSPAPRSGVPQNLVMLARAATEAGNDEEASTLWTRVLEHDPKNSEAWIGKAKAVPMTLGGMLAGYAQAESYCERAKESAADGDQGSYLVLSHLLDVMTSAAQEHFDEFMSVEGAGGEFLERVFFILDARERLAGPEGNPVEYQAAVDLCDKLLAHPIIGRLSDLKKDLLERRTRYLEKGGPVLVEAQADLDKHEKTGVAGAFGPARLAVAGIALVLLVVAIVGFGHWSGRTATTAPTPAAASISVHSPRAATTSWPPGGTEARANGFPQTIAIPGDSTWTILDVTDRGKVLTTISFGKKPITAAGRWIAVHFEVTNDAQTTAYSSPDPRIVDSTGRSSELWADESYDPYLPVAYANYRILSAEDVKPGLKADYWAIFQVLSNASGLRLRIHALKGKGVRDLPLQF